MLRHTVVRLVAKSAAARPHGARSFAIAKNVVAVDNPFTGETFTEVSFDTSAQAHAKLDAAAAAQRQWRYVPLSERQALCHKWIDALAARIEPIARDISGQMGKPLQQARNEVNGTIARAKALVYLSDEALRADTFPEENGLFRQITHEPVGVVYVIAPWNYPLMTAVNAIVPAVLAGNTVILKHSPRTPLCGVHYEETFAAAGFPAHVLQASFAPHDVAAELISRPETAFVSFTGSVNGGRQVQQVAAKRFIDVGLELGGNDAGYVAEDADPVAAAEGLVDGVCYNAGQSCCGIERIYVHEANYDAFLAAAAPLFDAYTLGDPLDATTTLGPMALPTAPAMLSEHVQDALAHGATQLTGSGASYDTANSRFVAPTLLANCTNAMRIMREESFGPIVGVQRVASDAEAVQQINDSAFGLTAAVFTSDRNRAMRLGAEISAGTVYMNRCDALDPLLPWSGVRDSGKGVSLSKHGFRAVTQLKAWNFRV